MKISRHENFAVSRSRPKNREIKMPRKMNLELNREIKMQQNTYFCPKHEIFHFSNWKYANVKVFF